MIINQLHPTRPTWAEHPVPGHHDCMRCGGYGTTDFGAPCPAGMWTGVRDYFAGITPRDVRAGVAVAALLLVAFLIVGSLT